MNAVNSPSRTLLINKHSSITDLLIPPQARNQFAKSASLTLLVHIHPIHYTDRLMLQVSRSINLCQFYHPLSNHGTSCLAKKNVRQANTWTQLSFPTFANSCQSVPTSSWSERQRLVTVSHAVLDNSQMLNRDYVSKAHLSPLELRMSVLRMQLELVMNKLIVMLWPEKSL